MVNQKFRINENESMGKNRLIGWYMVETGGPHHFAVNVATYREAIEYLERSASGTILSSSGQPDQWGRILAMPGVLPKPQNLTITTRGALGVRAWFNHCPDLGRCVYLPKFNGGLMNPASIADGDVLQAYPGDREASRDGF